MPHKKIGELVLEEKWLTLRELNSLLNDQKKRRAGGAKREDTYIGKLLVEQGIISQCTLDYLLQKQQNPIKDILPITNHAFGPFYIEKLIATGGTGAVYKAFCERSNKTLAIKVIHDKGFTGKVRARFLREIKMMKHLKHPNIVDVYDYGQISGIDYLAMQYLKGARLDEVIQKRTGGYRRWLENFLGLLEAIEAIHNANIVHRDLKPSNIMLTKDDRLVVFDFGLGKMLRQKRYRRSITTQIVGTPAYMAPEQTFLGGSHDFRTDIWALGVILYEILTQKLPFPEKEVQELLEAINHRSPLPIAYHVPSLPLELNVICQKALAKKQQDRYQNVSEMANVIRLFLKNNTEENGEDGKEISHAISQNEKNIHAVAESKRYKILCEIGRGGMGCVFKAYDSQLNRNVALKVVALSKTEEKHHERFWREAKTMAQLRHNNIVTIYDIGINEDTPFFVMDFIKGESLDVYVKNKKPDINSIVKILIQVGDAIHYAHKNGIIHRDLKPSNIMIENEQPKVMDFGLAKTQTNDSKTEILGTPLYMSPEQARGGNVDFRSDVYSLGATLYYVLSGVIPFQDERGNIFHKILRREPIPLHKLNSEIPSELAAICRKSMNKNRNKRYKNVAMWTQDLRNFLSYRPVIAQPFTVLSYFKIFIARYRLHVSVFLFFLFAVLGQSVFPPFTVLTIIVLITYIIYFTFYQWQRAEKFRQMAINANSHVEIDKQEITRIKQKHNLDMAQIALYKANEKYDNKSWRSCGVWAGVAIEYFQKVDLERKEKKQAKDLIRLALLKEGLLWKTKASYNQEILSFDYSPCGSFLVTGGKDKTIRIWSCKSGRELSSFLGHIDIVHMVVYSPDGKTITSASDDGTIRVWNTQSANVSVLPLHIRGLVRIVYSPDSNCILIGYRKKLSLWNIITVTQIAPFTWHKEDILALAYSADGESIISGGKDRNLCFWSPFSQEPTTTLFIHKTSVTSLCYSPDGKTFASGFEDGAVYLCSSINKKHIAIFEMHSDTIISLAYSPCSTFLVSASKDGTIILWNLKTQSFVRYVAKFSDMLRDVKFCRDGTAITWIDRKGMHKYSEGLEEKKKAFYQSDQVNILECSPCEKYIAIGRQDGTLCLFDIKSGQVEKYFYGHREAIYSFVFSPDGRYIASGSKDKTFRVWDIQKEKEISCFYGHSDSVWCLAYSPDGRFIASGSQDKTLRIWDVKKEKEIKRLGKYDDMINSLSYSPDGKILACHCWCQKVFLWNIETEECIATFDAKTLFTPVVFAPENTLLAYSYNQKHIGLYDYKNNQNKTILYGHTTEISSLCFDKSGKYLVSADTSGIIYIWDVKREKAIKRRRSYNEIIDISCTDMKNIAYGSFNHTINLWKTRIVSPKAYFYGHTKLIYDISLHHDGEYVASVSRDKTLHIWNMKQPRKKKVLQNEHEVHVVCYSPNEETLAFASKDLTIFLWDMKMEEYTATFKEHSKKITSLAYSPDGSILASGSYDKTISLWDLKTSKCKRVLRGHELEVESIVFSPDGTMIASASRDQTIRLWEANTGKQIGIFYGHSGSIFALQYSPNGQNIASGSVDKTVRIWDVETRKQIRELRGHKARIRSIAYNPDGETLASASGDKTIRIWDLQTGKTLEVLLGHDDIVSSVTYCPTGKTLISASWDKTLCLWDVSEIEKYKNDLLVTSWMSDGKEQSKRENTYTFRAHLSDQTLARELEENPRGITEELFDMRITDTFGEEELSQMYLYDV